MGEAEGKDKKPTTQTKSTLAHLRHDTGLKSADLPTSRPFHEDMILKNAGLSKQRRKQKREDKKARRRNRRPNDGLHEACLL